MFPPWILPSATLSRGVISKVVSMPAASLHVPSHSSKEMAGACNSSDISQTNRVTNQYNFKITRNPADAQMTSHGLMKLESLPPCKFDKCIPVPVVMQTTCAVYAGGSGGPVVAVHPSHG